MSPKARKSKVAAKPKAPAKKTTRKAAPARKKKAAKNTARTSAAAAKKKTARKAERPTGKTTAPARAAAASRRRKKPLTSRARKAKKPRRVRLGPKQVEHYRDLLLEKQRGLMAAYQISKGDSRSDLDDGTEDYIDYAVHSYAREFLLSLSEMDRKQLYLVDQALERLARNEFGHCQQCQQPILPKRLEVSPWVRYCVPCQELEEQGMLPDLAASEDADDETDDDEEISGSAAPALDDDSEESDDDLADDDDTA